MLFWVKLMWWSDSAISTSSRCRYRVWKLKHGAIFIKRDLKRKDNLPPFCSQFHTRMCDSMFRRGGREIAETITMWEKSETWSFKKVKLFDAEASFSQYSADGSLFLRPAVYYNGKSQWPSPPSLVFFFSTLLPTTLCMRSNVSNTCSCDQFERKTSCWFFVLSEA